jgi:hypothetical protein
MRNAFAHAQINQSVDSLEYIVYTSYEYVRLNMMMNAGTPLNH